VISQYFYKNIHKNTQTHPNMRNISKLNFLFLKGVFLYTFISHGKMTGVFCLVVCSVSAIVALVVVFPYILLAE